MCESKGIRRLESPQVVVVEASAGSGKTYCLTKRYLHLLINPFLKSNQVPLRNILAITFTNKATIEMKGRVLELLKRIALDAFPDKREEKDILASLGVNKSFARDKAKWIMNELIKHYSFFQIQTIDSFINALLIGCSSSIDRSANFKIKRDYFQYLCFCLDSVIDQARDDPEVLTILEEFLQHYLFVENRKGWFPKEDILLLLQSLFRLSNKHGKAFTSFEGDSNDVIKKKKYIFAQILQLAEYFPPGMNASAKKHIYSFLNKSNVIFDIANLPASLKNPQPPMNKDKDVPSDFTKRWQRIYDLLKELIELDAVVAYNPYVKLYRITGDFFQRRSKKEDVLFLEELNRKARLLFDVEGITVAEVYYRLATRFRHYLIDEFQDTSFLQWHNLEKMVEEALSVGGSLFYVGDKKQAIYRFRGGEAGLFDGVREEFTHFNVQNAYLRKNWRSQKAIVDFNNKIFSEDNLKRALKLSGIVKELGESKKDIDEILKVFKGAAQEERGDYAYGYVSVERIEEKNRHQRDEIMQPKILELLGELKGRFQYEDIAILVRDNSEVELVTSWLLEAGFPVESEKTLNVAENPLIKEIISFLNFLYLPLDNLSFAGFILGKIFSQVTKISHEDITEFIFKFHKEKKAGGPLPLYRLFRRKYSKVWSRYIDEFFKDVGFISPYELVVSIYQVLKVMENFKKNQAFFMKFLELIKQKESDYAGLGEFLSYLKEALPEDLYVNVSHSNSIKVLTTHKSKGLEFGVVIIPFLRINISPETGEMGSSSFVVPNGDKDLGVVRITRNHRIYSSALQDIYTQSYKKACVDELNNIYVALTRARFELYIFIPKKSSNGNNKAHYLISENISEGGSKKNYERKKTSTAVQPVIEMSALVHKGWLESVAEEFGDDQGIKNQKLFLEGNILHTILSQIGDCALTDTGKDADKEEMIRKALEITRIQYPFIKDFFSYESRVRKLLMREELRDIFFVFPSRVFCEKKIVNCFGDGKRIDRLIIKEKEIWVVDYKSTKEAQAEYKKQVIEYMRIIKDIYLNYEVRGFLVYLDEMVKEEVKV